MAVCRRRESGTAPRECSTYIVELASSLAAFFFSRLLGIFQVKQLYRNLRRTVKKQQPPDEAEEPSASSLLALFSNRLFVGFS